MARLFGIILVLLSIKYSFALTSIKCLEVPDFCKNLTSGSYRYMRVPNVFKDSRREDVSTGITSWAGLINHCHHGLKLFLCTIYAPVCVEGEEIKVCRAFCESVKTSCEPVLRSANISWPAHDAFNCSTYKDSEMCVKEEYALSSTARDASTTQPSDPTTTRSPQKEICLGNMNMGQLLQNACSSDLVLKVEVSSNLREAKGDSSSYLLKNHPRHKKPRGSRSSRKTKVESVEKMYLPKDGCGNALQKIKKGWTYLVLLERQERRKTKYIVKTILPWKKKFKRVVKRIGCKRL